MSEGSRQIKSQLHALYYAAACLPSDTEQQEQLVVNIQRNIRGGLLATMRHMKATGDWTDEDEAQWQRMHPKVRYGQCPVCLHYGDDCTGGHDAD